LPVPVSATVWGDPAALSAIDSVAVNAAFEAGVNVTVAAQLAPAASVVPQVEVLVKSFEPVPVTLTDVIESDVAPALVMVTV
jgi:hypothetical protein